MRDSNFNSTKYWIQRYKNGGNSGQGSYGINAKLKSEFLTNFISKHNIKNLVEYGCGDCNNLKITEDLNPGLKITGVDISWEAISKCKRLLPNQTFIHKDDYMPSPTDLVISLEVIFHLPEDEVFEEYMKELTSIGAKWIIILSPNEKDINEPKHVKKRKYTESTFLKDKYNLVEEVDFDRKKGGNIFSNWKIFKKING